DPADTGRHGGRSKHAATQQLEKQTPSAQRCSDRLSDRGHPVHGSLSLLINIPTTCRAACLARDEQANRSFSMGGFGFTASTTVACPASGPELTRQRPPNGAPGQK